MITKDVQSFLSRIEPFKGLPVHELENLGRQAQILTHSKGEYIFSEGDEAEYVWILKKGRLDIYKYTSDGKPRVIETINPGELFGTLCRMGGTGRTYPCTAMSAQTSIDIRIPEKLFMRLFSEYPSMVTGVCTLCSSRLNQLQDLSCASQESVDKRIARAIINLKKKNGVTVSITKREIAEIAATTVETTIRTMSIFEKNKWIMTTRGKLTIQNEKELENLMEGLTECKT